MINPHPQLETFLEPYNPKIQRLTMEVRAFILGLVPEANELIWDNYNALAIAYSISEKLKDAFCHIAVYAHHVNIGFNRGAELKKDILKLEGKGKLIRHFKLQDCSDFPKTELTSLIYEAVGLSEMLNPNLLTKVHAPKSMVMSISAKKIRPKPLT